MKRGRIENEQPYAAAIRQTVAEVNRDSKQRPQQFKVEDFYVFDLPEHNFSNEVRQADKGRPFSELKQHLNSLENQRR